MQALPFPVVCICLDIVNGQLRCRDWRLVERRDIKKYTRSLLIIHRLLRHVRCVRPAYYISAILIKHKLLVKHMFFR
jgi:hypothetical protein